MNIIRRSLFNKLLLLIFWLFYITKVKNHLTAQEEKPQPFNFGSRPPNHVWYGWPKHTWNLRGGLCCGVSSNSGRRHPNVKKQIYLKGCLKYQWIIEVCSLAPIISVLKTINVNEVIKVATVREDASVENASPPVPLHMLRTGELPCSSAWPTSAAVLVSRELFVMKIILPWSAEDSW